MALDYFQYQVDKLWYRLYWAFMLAVSLLLLGLYFGAQSIPALQTYAGFLHITKATAIFAGVNLAYLLTLYWAVTRYSLPFSTLVGSMLFSFLMLNGIWTADNQSGAYLYIGAWGVTTFLSGSFGLPLLAGGVFLTVAYTFMSNDFGASPTSIHSLILIGSTSVIAVAGYFFWKGKFISAEQQKVNQLSGMLRSNQQQSAVLLQSIADGVIVTNTSGKITLINPAAAKLTGWTTQDAMGVDVQLVTKLSNEDGSEITQEDDPFSQVLQQKQHFARIYQLVGKDGAKYVVSLVISPITGGDGAVAVIRDISDQRAAEKQRAEFISTASHEMRTPVAAIEGYLALALNEKVSTIDTRARSYLEKAHSSTQHLGKLFQDLLTSSKAEDGRLTNHPAVVEMGVFMQQLTDDLKFAAEKKGLLAEFVIGGADATIDATTKDASVQHLVKPLYYVHVDPDRIREVVTNLFDNACKYTDSGKISIGITGNNEVVQLYVRDTGAGIPKEDLGHLFQKFYRVDNSATRTIGGTGLGLFICRKIVELYHGRIWVESEVGKGSTFFINLPRLTTQRATELQASENTPKPAITNANQATPAKS